MGDRDPGRHFNDLVAQPGQGTEESATTRPRRSSLYPVPESELDDRPQSLPIDQNLERGDARGVGPVAIDIGTYPLTEGRGGVLAWLGHADRVLRHWSLDSGDRVERPAEH